MIPSQQRLRMVAAACACLAGLVIAFALISSRSQEATSSALALVDGSDGAPSPAPEVAEGSASAAIPRAGSALGRDPGPDPDSNTDTHPNVRGASDNGGEGEDVDDQEDEDGATSLRSRDDGPPRDRPRPLGSLDKASIQEAMNDVRPLLRACFDEALQHHPSLAGRVVVEFEIAAADDERGVVTQGSVVDSETASPFFEACVLQKVAGLEMPVPPGGGVVKVRYPFLFDPGGGYGGEPPASDHP